MLKMGQCYLLKCGYDSQLWESKLAQSKAVEPPDHDVVYTRPTPAVASMATTIQIKQQQQQPMATQQIINPVASAVSAASHPQQQSIQGNITCVWLWMNMSFSLSVWSQNSLCIIWNWCSIFKARNWSGTLFQLDWYWCACIYLSNRSTIVQPHLLGSWKNLLLWWIIVFNAIEIPTIVHFMFTCVCVIVCIGEGWLVEHWPCEVKSAGSVVSGLSSDINLYVRSMFLMPNIFSLSFDASILVSLRYKLILLSHLLSHWIRYYSLLQRTGITDEVSN